MSIDNYTATYDTMIVKCYKINQELQAHWKIYPYFKLMFFGCRIWWLMTHIDIRSNILSAIWCKIMLETRNLKQGSWTSELCSLWFYKLKLEKAQWKEKASNIHKQWNWNTMKQKILMEQMLPVSKPFGILLFCCVWMRRKATFFYLFPLTKR